MMFVFNPLNTQSDQLWFIGQKFSTTAGPRPVQRTVLVAAEFHSDVSFGLSGGQVATRKSGMVS
jgi:hypothetical protein